MAKERYLRKVFIAGEDDGFLTVLGVADSEHGRYDGDVEVLGKMERHLVPDLVGQGRGLVHVGCKVPGVADYELSDRRGY
ncbi:hypothetical protein SDC9_200938 [bioreactor metagenome]|uniref:Uncharacterized protein n=1 Tax=bioreactor metagenome TaxID=1076179 RepID=A0A645IYB8_9ZZZZ